MKAPKYANFIKIDDYLYRGSRPHYTQIKELKKMGINQIYDFRNISLDDGFNKIAEKILCKIYKIKYIRMPYFFKKEKYPSMENLEKVSKSIENNGKNGGCTLIHCRSGKHRTGQHVAWYEFTKGKTIDELKNSNDFYLNAYNLILKFFNFDNKEYWSRTYKSEVVENKSLRMKNIDNNRRIDVVHRATIHFLETLYSIKQ